MTNPGSGPGTERWREKGMDGYDWRAINAFAGSELRFFKRFEEYFGDAVQLEIPTNYRSVNSVVEVGNALMHGSGNMTGNCINNATRYDRKSLYFLSALDLIASVI